MAKVTMPLLGTRASGTVGKSLVFGNWKGINYARQHAVPANPRTTAQQAQRGLIKFTTSFWQRAPSAVQNSFIASAKGSAMTGFNLFTKRNTMVLRGESNLNLIVLSPGQSGATGLASVTATGGSGTITASAALADGIPGTTVTRVHFVALRNAAPNDVYSYNPYHVSDSTSPYSVTFNSLPAGQYVVAAFTECVESSGKTVYSVNLNQVVTVS
jgi:hypothetical protein